jgi:Ca2+-transporting ATPase
LDVCRYFTGHTTNPDGSVKFLAGKTKVSDAVDDAIKIVTVAVCMVYLFIIFFMLVYV